MWSSCSTMVSITTLYRIIFEPSLDGSPSYMRLSRRAWVSARGQDRAEDVRRIRPSFRDDRGDQGARRQVEQVLHRRAGPGRGVEARIELERLACDVDGFLLGLGGLGDGQRSSLVHEGSVPEDGVGPDENVRRLRRPSRSEVVRDDLDGNAVSTEGGG